MLIDPTNITNYKCTNAELEIQILFWILVAGKTAKYSANKLTTMLEDLEGENEPFQAFKDLGSDKKIADFLLKNGIGCYNSKAATIHQIVNSSINLRTCSYEDLEKIKGIGRKTSRCFLLHTRENAQVCGADTHVLKFLRVIFGDSIPTSTPGSYKKYKEIEQLFLQVCKTMGKKPAVLDLKIWNAYSSNNISAINNLHLAYKYKVYQSKVYQEHALPN